MAWGPQRQLDAVGIVLAVAVVALIGLVVFSALTIVGGSAGSDVPDNEWGIEKVDENTIQLRHETGEPVRGEDLVVVVDGQDRPSPFEGTVTPGDTEGITVSKTPDVVEIHWSGGNGPEDTLARQEIGDE